MAETGSQEIGEGNLGRKKWGKRLMAAAFFVPLAAGMGWFVHHRSTSGKKGTVKAETTVKSVMHLDPFVVNLADREEDRFLRVGIELGLERELDERGHPAQAAMSLARTRDTILSILTACDAETLVSPQGKAILKEQLAKALRERAPELGVREVYFTEFLVQR